MNPKSLTPVLTNSKKYDKRIIRESGFHTVLQRARTGLVSLRFLTHDYLPRCRRRRVGRRRGSRRGPPGGSDLPVPGGREEAETVRLELIGSLCPSRSKDSFSLSFCTKRAQKRPSARTTGPQNAVVPLHRVRELRKIVTRSPLEFKVEHNHCMGVKRPQSNNFYGCHLRDRVQFTSKLLDLCSLPPPFIRPRLDSPTCVVTGTQSSSGRVVRGVLSRARGDRRGYGGPGPSTHADPVLLWRDTQSPTLRLKTKDFDLRWNCT